MDNEELEQKLIENARQMNRFLDQEIKGLDYIEGELEREMDRVDQATRKADELIKIQRDEINNIQEIMSDIKDIEKNISQDPGSEKELHYIDKQVLEDLKEALGDIKKINEEIETEKDEAFDENETFIEAVNELKAAVEINNKIRHSLELANNTERALEEIATSENFTELENALRTDKEELRSAQKLFGKLEDEEARLEQKLEGLSSEINDQIGLESEAIREIKQELDELPQIMKSIERGIEPVAQREKEKLESGEDRISRENNKINLAKEIVTEVQKIEKDINLLNKHLEHIIELKESEIQLEKKIEESETKNLELIKNYTS